LIATNSYDRSLAGNTTEARRATVGDGEADAAAGGGGGDVAEVDGGGAAGTAADAGGALLPGTEIVGLGGAVGAGVAATRVGIGVWRTRAEVGAVACHAVGEAHFVDVAGEDAGARCVGADGERQGAVVLCRAARGAADALAVDIERQCARRADQGDVAPGVGNQRGACDAGDVAAGVGQVADQLAILHAQAQAAFDGGGEELLGDDALGGGGVGQGLGVDPGFDGEAVAADGEFGGGRGGEVAGAGSGERGAARDALGGGDLGAAAQTCDGMAAHVGEDGAAVGGGAGVSRSTAPRPRNGPALARAGTHCAHFCSGFWVGAALCLIGLADLDGLIGKERGNRCQIKSELLQISLLRHRVPRISKS